MPDFLTNDAKLSFMIVLVPPLCLFPTSFPSVLFCNTTDLIGSVPFLSIDAMDCDGLKFIQFMQTSCSPMVSILYLSKMYVRRSCLQLLLCQNNSPFTLALKNL